MDSGKNQIHHRIYRWIKLYERYRNININFHGPRHDVSTQSRPSENEKENLNKLFRLI